MTSACGVVEHSTPDDGAGSECAFSGMFEEFFCDADSMTVFKVQPSAGAYEIGDELPVCGESYRYPDSFDIVSLHDITAVSVRSRRITSVVPLAAFSYGGVPVISGNGFAVHITDADGAEQFKRELAAAGSRADADFLRKWMDFETYRRIVFREMRSTLTYL
jgi:sulfate adenylyltransferase subunit 1